MPTTAAGTPTSSVRLLLTLPLVPLLVLLGACAGGGSDDAMGGDPGLHSDSEAADVAAGEGLSEEDAADEAGGSDRAATGRKAAAQVASRAAEKVVSTGTVSLVSDDVAATRFDVQRVADQQAGEVAESQTDTADDGEVVRSRMVLRVPVKAFATAVEAIEGLAELRSSEQGSEVVTEEYVDLQARVRAQEASLARVELLFSRANSIRDVMAVEGQLTSRQADLDALKGRLRALEDRAAMSTITVHLERTPTVQREENERAGFLTGLGNGWDALSSTAVALATVLGAVLPFALALALLGLPVWLLVRLRGRSARTRSAGPAGPGPSTG